MSASVREAAPRQGLSSAVAEALLPVPWLEVPPGRSRRRGDAATDGSTTRLPPRTLQGTWGAASVPRELVALQPIKHSKRNIVFYRAALCCAELVTARR